MDEETLLECFRDPESTATDEDRALRLLSRHPHPERVREIRDQEAEWYSDRYRSSLLHYACQSGWYDVSRELVDKYQCDPHLESMRGNTPLHCACKGGSIDIVRFLIVDHHRDPACRGEWDRTPLHCACKSGKLDIVKFLVEECHCDPRVKDWDGDTPLHYACKGGSIDIVRFLIVDHHCDPACRGKEDETPLHCACESGKLDIVKFLVEECHCDPGVQDGGGDTPLHFACEGGSIDIVRFLIVDHNCDPTWWGWDGRTPLHWACKSGDLGFVKFLVEECHCDPTVKEYEYDNTPLHCACKGGSIDIVRFLIVDHHCDPACCGQTPLKMACKSGDLGFVKFLVEECHCDPRVKEYEYDNTPLHCACKGGSIDIVRFLIVDHHCDPACHGREGRTPLYWACVSGKLDIVKFLVEECHCDPGVQDGGGDTPLHFACEGGSIDIVRFLIVDHNCDPTWWGWDGRTPLHWACKSGDLGFVKFLVEECHCDPTVKEYEYDNTPLHCACKGGSIDIVRFLIVDHHCDPACCGQTPLKMACKSGDLGFVKFLVEECHCDPRVKEYEYDNTPLHCACKGGSIDIVRFLIVDHHCDPACHGREGRTPLYWACVSGKLDIVKFLVEECHCDPTVKDEGGNTPLHYALHYACKGGSIDIVRFLIVDHHCDPACHGREGRTPLQWACESGKLDIVKFLVEECHCDPTVKERNGNTPLHCACEGGSIDIVRFLIVDHHCDPACHGREGRTPLHCACKSGKLDIVKFLVEECHCDPTVKERNGNTPLHCACEGGSIDTVRFLIVDHHCDPACREHWGRTPLYCACESGKLDIVKFLVEECHWDPFRGKDEYGKTPLHLAAELRTHDDVLLFLLSHIPPLKQVNFIINNWLPPPKILQAFVKCRTEYPLESAFKIFVLGNHAAGKSTLVKVIENEITSFFGSFGGQLRNISKSAVVPLTAGIIPVSIESRRLGQIVIYDMAGQYQYYSSHAALLRNLVSSSASMFLVVVSLNQEKEEIIRQLQYWNSFVDNCCSSAGRPLTVAVFSHADEVTEDKPERKSSEIVKGLAHSETSSSFSEVVTLDCRKLASGGLTKISKIVAGCCAKFRQTFRFDFAVHLLYAFISSRLADRIACTVSELQSLIKQEQGEDSFALEVKGREILPTNTTELCQHLTMLSNKGQFLFLRNAQKVEDSWVVIDKAVLLSEVNGTIFAPDNFKQHHKIANSTGVVPFSKIREVFPERDPDMVVTFLQHLEFCQEIPETEVSLISRRHFRCSSGPVERFFFFPALVSEERPSGAGEAIDTPSYRCGWTLQCSRPHQFLTPQFLHVLLLRLAFSFALAHDNPHEVLVSPVLERRCFVWKNGICWLSRDGIETTVEETKQNSTYTVTMQYLSGQELECTRYCSQVVKCILEAKDELCPTVTVRESLVHPDCLATRDIDSQHTFSIAEVAKALAEDKLFVVSQPGGKMVRIDDLLYFEPYAYINIGWLFAEDNPNKVVSEIKVSKTCHTKLDQLKQALGIDSTKFQAGLARAPPFLRDQPEYQCKLVFQVWKENTQSPTYRALRSALDKYSVFCGRNPLVSCECTTGSG